MFLLNGEPATHLPLSDRAIQYGDGLFETIACKEGRLEFWQRHMARLREGCQRLNMALPDEGALLAEARRLLEGRGDAVLKIIISRGSGGRGYRFPGSEACPQRILGRYDWPDYPPDSGQGVDLRWCQTPLGLSPSLAGLKHLNRLEQVLARNEWDDPKIAEGVMQDVHGHVIEGTMTNLFFVRDGSLCTPDLSNCGVAGIIRGVVLEIAQQLDIPVDCGIFQRADIERAEEVFITNSLIGLWPVRKIEQNTYRVGLITGQVADALGKGRCKKEEYETV